MQGVRVTETLMKMMMMAMTRMTRMAMVMMLMMTMMIRLVVRVMVMIMRTMTTKLVVAMACEPARPPQMLWLHVTESELPACPVPSLLHTCLVLFLVWVEDGVDAAGLSPRLSEPQSDRTGGESAQSISHATATACE